MKGKTICNVIEEGIREMEERVGEKRGGGKWRKNKSRKNSTRV
jgi:hypothetical protein